MVDLLAKFENVKVDAASRISPEDAAWCEGEQTNYRRAHKLYTEFRAAVAESMKLESEDWKKRSDRDYNSYTYCESHGDAGLSDIDKRVTEIQNNFIAAVRYYFSGKYSIELDSEIINKSLGMIAPKHDYSMADSLWEKVMEEYREKSTRLLNYNEIVDEILLQLDGLTFTDKAVQQIKDKAKEGAHNRYHNTCYYTVNKKMIQFKEPFTHYDEQYRAVLLALWHFNTGLMSMTGSYWSSELNVRHSYHSEDKRVGSAYEFEGKKACKLRYFKSGRWDVTFATAEYADTFAREYLGY